MRQQTLYSPAFLGHAFVVAVVAANALATPSAYAQKVAPAQAAPIPGEAPRLVLAGKPYAPANPNLAPYRDPMDNQVCLSPEALSGLGIVYVDDERMGLVTLSVLGSEATATVARRTSPSGSVAVSLVSALEGLGGKCQWVASANTLYCRAVVTQVEMLGGQLRLRATLPILPRVTRMDGGRKIVVDVDGAEVGKLPKTLELNSPSVRLARAGQFNDDTARIVLEMDDAANFAVLETKPAPLVVLNPAPLGVSPARVTGFSPLPKRPSAPPTAKNGPTQVSDIAFRSQSDRKAQFVIRAGRAPVTRTTLSRNRLTLDLLNANIAPSVAASLSAAKHPFIKAARIVTQGGAARLVLDLTRAVSFVVKPSTNGQVVLDLNLPKSAGGTLAGKLVVVDAGHGLQDNGARGVNGQWEKNLNLAIATQLAEILRDQGANVQMIRSNDDFLSVNERPRVANRAGADFFISVHCDSSSNRSASGSTVYFHAADPNCRALARSITDQFEQMGGIRSRGTRTDYTLHSTGLGVLRGARMVAVLVECGFVTNYSDVSRLSSPDMQRRIAASIAAGLKNYVEGNPNTDYRSNNPYVGGEEMLPPVELPETEGEGTPGEPETVEP